MGQEFARQFVVEAHKHARDRVFAGILYAVAVQVVPHIVADLDRCGCAHGLQVAEAVCHAEADGSACGVEQGDVGPRQTAVQEVIVGHAAAEVVLGGVRVGHHAQHLGAAGHVQEAAGIGVQVGITGVVVEELAAAGTVVGAGARGAGAPDARDGAVVLQLPVDAVGAVGRDDIAARAGRDRVARRRGRAVLAVTELVARAVHHGDDHQAVARQFDVGDHGLAAATELGAGRAAAHDLKVAVEDGRRLAGARVGHEVALGVFVHPSLPLFTLGKRLVETAHDVAVVVGRRGQVPSQHLLPLFGRYIVLVDRSGQIGGRATVFARADTADINFVAERFHAHRPERPVAAVGRGSDRNLRGDRVRRQNAVNTYHRAAVQVDRPEGAFVFGDLKVAQTDFADLLEGVRVLARGAWRAEVGGADHHTHVRYRVKVRHFRCGAGVIYAVDAAEAQFAQAHVAFQERGSVEVLALRVVSEAIDGTDFVLRLDRVEDRGAVHRVVRI